MSYEVRFTGTLTFPSRSIRDAAVGKMRQALEDEDECESESESFVAVEDLRLEGKSLHVELEGSCPATLWEETLAFLEILGNAAVEGAIRGYFEGDLTDTVKASAKRKPAPSGRKTKRVRQDPHALRMAAQFGQLDKVAALLAAGTDPSAVDASNSMATTPLMMAAYHGRQSVLAHLLSAGAALDSVDALGNTALFHAASNKNRRGRQRCLELLVDAGAKIEVRNRGDQTALQYAQSIRASGGADELRALLSGSQRKRTYGGKKTVPRS